MNQFPIGMEMFSAADDDQWKIIKEAIDSSDFYILIIGNRYGSIEETTGISYTEKEFDYAVEKKIPVLAFIVDSSMSMTADKFETDIQKIAKLSVFKEKVKQSGRYVKFWKNVDNLETLISQSISKAVIRGNRPGWVRTTDFDIDKSYAEILRLTERVHTLEALNSDLRMENNRKPILTVDVYPDLDEDGKPIEQDAEAIENGIHLNVHSIDMTDAENGVDYRDVMGKLVHADKEEVKLIENGRLEGNTVVATIMSNLGLFKALEKSGIDYLKTTVGDKYVNEAMVEHGYVLGGEQSGHIIFSKHATTGDGMLTAIMLMEVILEKKQSLHALCEGMKMYPQYLENVRVSDKKAVTENPAVQKKKQEIEEELAGNGRIILRESGTEPVIRVMAEADSDELCRKYVGEMVEVIKTIL